MACNGDRKPRYKRRREIRWNPFYLAEGTDRFKSELDFLGLNTTDEFITVEISVEDGTLCAGCEKELCVEARKKEIRPLHGP